MTSSRQSDRVQRVGFLARLPKLLREFGVEPTELLQEAGLPPDALSSPDNQIPYATMGILTALAVERSGCAHLGLEVGRQVRTASLGLVGEVMRHSATLRAALQNFAIHQHQNARGGVGYLIEHPQHATIGYAIYEPDMVGFKEISDGAAMAAFSLVCELTGGSTLHEMKILFARSEPVDLEPYRQAFGAGPKILLRFNADQTAIVFSPKLLDQTIAGADGALLHSLEERIRNQDRTGDLDLAEHLARELRTGIIRRHFSAHEVAAQLGMTEWTLARHLKTSGLSFQAAFDEARYVFTKQLLVHTNLDLKTVAQVVGFANASALTRGFTRWVGIPPSLWRQANRVPFGQTRA